MLTRWSWLSKRCYALIDSCRQVDWLFFTVVRFFNAMILDIFLGLLSLQLPSLFVFEVTLHSIQLQLLLSKDHFGALVHLFPV